MLTAAGLPPCRPRAAGELKEALQKAGAIRG